MFKKIKLKTGKLAKDKTQIKDHWNKYCEKLMKGNRVPGNHLEVDQQNHQYYEKKWSLH